MGHRTCVLLGVFACFLGLNINLWSQSIPAVNGIRGYLDPRTGIFHSIPLPDLQEADVPPPATFGGKLVFNFTITVSSTLASTAKILCEASASTEDAATLIMSAGVVQPGSVADPKKVAALAGVANAARIANASRLEPAKAE